MVELRQELDAQFDSKVPAAYTYFGQFVDHDVSKDDTMVEADDPTTDIIEPTADSALVQKRTPALDLDSVYGDPISGGAVSPCSDGVRFDFALTESSSGRGHSRKQIKYDLVRGERPDGKPFVAIPDSRNDENLAVAQMHALWMRFHNVVADEIEKSRPGTNTELLFELSREVVVRHYQYIVLHDFLKRVVDGQSFSNIIEKKQASFFRPVVGEESRIPLEFSSSAYRFGHTLVRQLYEWNSNFSSDGEFGQPADFGRVNVSSFSLFKFTTNGVNGGDLSESKPLPTNWLVDWRRLFDFAGIAGADTSVPHQFAKSIDPYLSVGMGNLPGAMDTLAGLNLRRSGLRGLPSAQDILGLTTGIKPLSQAELTKGLDPVLAGAIKKQGFDVKTPLWLYVLQEGNVRHGGKKLGPLGSCILCETFLGLIRTSPIPILADGWTPKDSPLNLQGGVVDSIPKLLTWVDERQPIINPLEDSRIT